MDAKLLKEFEDTEPKTEDSNRDEPGIFPTEKSWLKEIIASMILSGVWLLISAKGLIESFEFTVAVLYAVLLFVFMSVAILCVIIVIEYAYRSVRRTVKKNK